MRRLCVYLADCSEFSTNGNGTLDPLSATVTETMNGEYVNMSCKEDGSYRVPGIIYNEKPVVIFDCAYF